MRSTDVQVLANRRVRYCFDRTKGSLVSVTNRATGNECLQGSTGYGNMFCVYYDFLKEFEVTGAKGMTPLAAVSPSEISRRTFSPHNGHIVAMREKPSGASRSLTMTYEDADHQWRVKLTVTLHGESPGSIWKMSLQNISDSSAECMCSFPLISGVRLGDGKRNLMVVNDQAGYILPLWSAEGGIYGNASYMSMQWGCVFDEASKDAFAFIIRDSELRNKQIRYSRPSIEVNYFPPSKLAAGQSMTIPVQAEKTFPAGVSATT